MLGLRRLPGLGEPPALLRRLRVSVAERLLNIALAAFCLIGYHQLAAPACRGEAHSLPLDSPVLRQYPCHGSPSQKLWYGIMNTSMVFRDSLSLGLQEAWISGIVAVQLFRMVSSFLLPAQIYSELVAPLSVYYIRAATVVHYLLLGPNAEPSALSLDRLFRTLAVFDVGVVCSLLLVWRVNVALELAHCAAMAAGLLVLCRWHGHLVPGGVNLAWQMATRALVPCITLYLGQGRNTRGSGRGRGGPVGTGFGAAGAAAVAAGRSSGAGGGGHCESDTRVKKAEVWEDKWEEEEEAPGAGSGSGRISGSSGGSRGGGRSADVPPRGWDVSCARNLGPWPGCGPEAPSECPMQAPPGVEIPGPTGPISEISVQPEPRDAVRGPSPRSAAPVAGQEGCGGDAAAAAAAAAPLTEQTIAGGFPPSSGSRSRSAAAMPYRSFVDRQVSYYKIPEVEPEQLPPDYEQRLRQLAASRGFHLAAAYVRRGCVELTLVLEKPRDGAALGGPPSSPPPQSSPPLDPAALVRALGLPPRPGVRAATLHPLLQPAGAICGSKGGADAPEAVFSGSGDDVSGAGDQFPSSAAPGMRDERCRVASAWPRVVLLPRRLSPEGAKGREARTGDGPGRPGQMTEPHGSTAQMEGGARSGALHLRVVVAWSSRLRSQLTHGSVELQARATHASEEVLAGAETRPTDVRLEAVRVGVYHGSGSDLEARVAARDEVVPGDDDDDDDGAAAAATTTWKYDLSIGQLPRRPGWLWVTLSLGDLTRGGAGARGRSLNPPHGVVLPLLVVDDADVAAELAAAAGEWPHSARDELDDLLYDIGTWAAAAAEATSGQTDDAAATATAAAPGPPRLGPLHAALGPHLLCYARAAGWGATEEWIRGLMRGCGLICTE